MAIELSTNTDYDQQRLMFELRRMLHYKILSLSNRQLENLSIILNEWMRVFSQADQFVAMNQSLLIGQDVLPCTNVRPISNTSDIADVFLLLSDPPTEMSARDSWMSNGSNSDVAALRLSVVDALFVHPGKIVYLKDQKNSNWPSEETESKYFKNTARICLYSDDRIAKKTPGYTAYLQFNPAIQIAMDIKKHNVIDKRYSFHVELKYDNKELLLLLDKESGSFITYMFARSVTHLPDGHFEVQSLQFHPNPIFCHFASRTNELFYAVPIESEGCQLIVPGSGSPDATNINLEQNILQRYMFE